MTLIYLRLYLQKSSTFFIICGIGIIHGDFNEQNILCNKDVTGEWYVCAVLDFGDAHYSAYVFELAITMCYMMMQSCLLYTSRCV